jgi:hypothetical protein
VAGAARDGQVTLPLERLVEIGAEQGFKFSSEEIVAAYTRRAGIKVDEVSKRKAQSELDETELDAVAGGADVLPMDSFSLNFGKITFTYSEQKKDGSLSGSIDGSYDLTQQSKK